MNIKFQSSYTLNNRYNNKYNNLIQSQNNNQIIENTKIKDNSIGVSLELGKSNSLVKSTVENLNRDVLFNIKQSQNYLDNIEKQLNYLTDSYNEEEIYDFRHTGVGDASDGRLPSRS